MESRLKKIVSEIPGGEEREIVYTVKYSQRRSVGITVYPDQKVVVRAPKNYPAGKIREIVHKKGDWILKKQREFNKVFIHSGNYDFIPGEPFLYLGRIYRLSLVSGKTGGQAEVFFEAPDKCSLEPEEGRLIVTVKKKSGDKGKKPGELREEIKRKLTGFYRREAERILGERFRLLSGKIKAEGIDLGLKPEKGFALRRMRRRWGSCSREGKILLNTFLVCVPLSCIDYVILHELCHLKEKNHASGFYRLLERILPSFREQRDLLKKQIVPYF